MREEIEQYVDGLGLDAYLVGGAVRDELLGLESKDADFLVPGVDTEGLKERFYPTQTIETSKETLEWLQKRMPPGIGS